MQPIILGLIIFLVVSLLGVALFYVGTKLLYNVSTDISNASITTKANKGPNLPTIPDDSNVTTTTPASGNLELWSETGFQGNVTIVPLSDIQAYESLVTTIDTSSTKSIRYPPNGYQGYYYVTTTVPTTEPTANDVKNNGNLLDHLSQSLQIEGQNDTFYIAIFNTTIIGNIISDQFKTTVPNKSYSILHIFNYMNNNESLTITNFESLLKNTSIILILFKINYIGYLQSSVFIGNIKKVSNNYISDFQIIFSPANNNLIGIIHYLYDENNNILLQQTIKVNNVRIIDTNQSQEHLIQIQISNFGLDGSTLTLDSRYSNYNNKYVSKFCNIMMKLNGIEIINTITWYDNINLNNIICYKGEISNKEQPDMTIDNCDIQLSNLTINT
jgi:hypothetical protein